MSHLADAVGLHGLKKAANVYGDAVGLHGLPGFKDAATAVAEGAALLGGGMAVSGALPGMGAAGAAAGEAGAAGAAGGSGGWLSSLFSTTAGGSSIGSALVGGLMQSLAGGGKSASSAADPFASQRPGYQAMLAQMMTGQGFTPQDPSYAWRFGQGEQALERSIGAKGLLNSGNRLTALTDYGQGQASMEYSNQFARLAGLAGANAGSPAAAGQLIQQQQAGEQQSLAALGNLIGTKVSGWLNAPSSAPASEVYDI